MTDADAKSKTDAKIERLYDRGLELAKSPDTREQGRAIFLAGMDVAVKATDRAVKIQKQQLKYQQ